MPLTLAHQPFLGFLFAGIAAAAPVCAFADPTDVDCRQASEECVAVGRWNFSIALGAGLRTNPLINSENLPLVIVPQFSYYGERFFVNNLDLGFTFAENDANSLSLVASPSYDRVFFYRSDLQNIFVGLVSGAIAPVGPTSPGAVPFPPRSRRITYLAGPEWTFKLQEVTGQLDVLHEVTDQNRGNEVRAALGVPLPQTSAKDSLAVSLGFTWKSAAIVNYYYGAPNIYQGRAVLDPFIKFNYPRPLSGKWRFNALVQYERLGSGVADSPIVVKDYVVTVFFGAIYAF